MCSTRFTSRFRPFFPFLLFDLGIPVASFSLLLTEPVSGVLLELLAAGETSVPLPTGSRCLTGVGGVGGLEIGALFFTASADVLVVS